MAPSFQNLLLTGVPGIGKTTVIRKVAAGLVADGPGGFFTEEIRENGERRGFCLVDFQGGKRLIAHVDLPRRYRVGKYGVDLSAIDDAAVRMLAVDPARDIYLVDEIGKMECLSSAFVTAMRRLLDANVTVVATVGKKGTGFIAEVKRRDDCLLWEITRGNRDEIPQEVLQWLGSTHASGVLPP